jgi:hypothetical protein
VRTTPRILLLTLAALALIPAGDAPAKSSIRVGIADQSPAMFGDPAFQRAKIRRTRYFVAADVMRDTAERMRARTFVKTARAANVSVLLHISTADLRSKRGARVSTTRYRSDVGRIVAYFRDLGVRDFGAWNEVNHKSQETWDSPGHTVSYFKSMYRAVKQGSGPPKACRSCAVVGLDVLDQAGVERYVRSVYRRLSSTWRKRLSVVGIHNYSDVNRNRSTGTGSIIRTVRRYNRRTKFWFTETGAVASFGGSFPYSEARQASRIRNMFNYASRYRRSGVQRVYSYNWFGVPTATGCRASCPFDAGLVGADGRVRPVYDAFRKKLSSYSR